MSAPIIPARYEWTVVSPAGVNDRRQLGNNSTTPSNLPVNVPSLDGVVQIGPGSSHTCVVVGEVNRVACWGANDRGQAGRPMSPTVGAPVLVDAGSLQFIEVHGGDAHTCALATDKTLWCWGKDDSGQLGNGTTTSETPEVPVQVLTAESEPLENVEQFMLGANHACALLENDQI